jgi:hypothetical protein
MAVNLGMNYASFWGNRNVGLMYVSNIHLKLQAVNEIWLTNSFNKMYTRITFLYRINYTCNRMDIFEERLRINYLSHSIYGSQFREELC